MSIDLPRTFDHRAAESRWYSHWEDGGYFRADPASPKPTFSVVIPPPNVTGALHMGHMLNLTVHDAVVRCRRMQGYNTLWLPGTDHAGIATQNVVERELREEGLSRHDLGREKFVERVWEWRREYGGIITSQIRRIGASCDWSRERFTLDEGLSGAVREVFVRLYEDGLVYRGERLINWCPRCRTALSDLEVEHREIEGQLYRVRYPLRGPGDRAIELATTRPETMLGDTALAVNPADERYRGLAGQVALLPLVGRELRFIEDALVDPEFGTGIVKVTPAHDPADFEMGERHDLPRISVIDEDGRITAAGPYRDLDRFEARERIVRDLEALGRLVAREPHRHKVGHCSRCSTIVEPLLSMQWFVRTPDLAKEAIRAVEDGRIRFVPPEWARTYFQWMRNIRDWCISRQLWWGHRIPAWYCGDCSRIVVSREDPAACDSCGSRELTQDEDVLDTWFSSWLWPFSSMGWPADTPELRTFYPTDVLITGFDIIFFWVARMIMAGLRFTGEAPFREVYITGLVRDRDRQKMSKSRGNVIDPLGVCDEYGTDAVRFALARLGVPGSDLVLTEDQLESYRAFTTKIWNAARFILSHAGDAPEVRSPESLAATDLRAADRWILSRMAAATAQVNEALDRYALYEAARLLYQFFWHEFCDWYLEMTKLHPERSGPVLLSVLELSLRLLHPFMPFLTEEVWQKLPGTGASITVAPYPGGLAALRDEAVEREIGLVQEVIGRVRNIRSEVGLDARAFVRLRVAVDDPLLASTLRGHEEYLHRLARVERLEIAPVLPPDGPAAAAVAGGLALEVPLRGLIDVDAYEARLHREIERARREIDSLERKMGNVRFVERAPVEVVEENRQRLADYRETEAKLVAGLERLR
jgi:valyl-tRNA synthetase